VVNGACGVAFHRGETTLIAGPQHREQNQEMRIGLTLLIATILMTAACDQALPAQASAQAQIDEPVAGESCRVGDSKWKISQGISAKAKAVPAKNVIELDADDHLYWNEAPIDRSTLRLYAAQRLRSPPQPLTVLRVDPHAGCGMIRAAAGDIDGKVTCTPSICSLEWSPLPHDPERPELQPRL
jgi:biopolymer transport protein ExbD